MAFGSKFMELRISEIFMKFSVEETEARLGNTGVDGC